MNPLEKSVNEYVPMGTVRDRQYVFGRTVGLSLLLCACLLLRHPVRAVADPPPAPPAESPAAAADSAVAGPAGVDSTVADLARDLSACLPPAAETWEAEPVEINAEKTDLKKGRIDAYRLYTRKAGGGRAQVIIRIERSAWDVWLVNFASDLQRLKFGTREGILDLSKHAAIVYVPIEGNLCAVFKAEDQPKTVEQLAKGFAAETDFDCLARILKK